MEMNQRIQTTYTELPTGHKLYYKFGQIVYLKTDTNQSPRIITGFSLRPNRSVMYYLGQGNQESVHFSIEISEEKDILISTNN